jgi:hypothetical protein
MADCECIGNFRYAADGSVVDMCSCGRRYCRTCSSLTPCTAPSEDVTCIKNQTRALELRDEELLSMVEALQADVESALEDIEDHESRITALEP